MAILDNVPGLKAEVLVDGRPLREYDDDEEASPNAVIKYVEVQSGAEFRFKSTFSAPFPLQYGVQITGSVDGSAERRTYLSPDELYRVGAYAHGGIMYQEDGKWFQRNYRFTALSIVEETEDAADIAGLQKELATKGCITLKYRYITNIRPTERKRKGPPERGFAALGAIPEKALKGDSRSHQATLGAPFAIGRMKPKLVYDVVDQEPFATFHFKYRSLAALRALRIVTAEEANLVPLEERPEEELTPAELREALRRMRRREAETRTIKHEGEVQGQTKREHGTGALVDDEVTVVAIRSRKRPRVDPEVIVLD